MIPTATTYIDNLVPPRGRFPFYIVAPRWTRTSAGIRSLHILCHWLNMTGQSAFMLIYPEWQGLQVNPDLQTPVLTEAIAQHHFEMGIPPIVVYPEVIAGNPFDAPVRVRWIGNYPGFLGGTATFDTDELCFAHSEHLARTVGVSNVLNIPVLDTSVYRPMPVASRAGSCFYAAKFQHVHNQTVFGLPEGCIEITRDGPGTLSPPEIADLFRRSELFYCFENSALINEAALCGCPVMMMKNTFFDAPIAIDEAGWDGYAWGDHPDEIARARRTVDHAYDNYVRNVPKFFTQLYSFVLLTQKRAATTPYVKPVRLLNSLGHGPAETRVLRRRLLDAVLDLEAIRSDARREHLLWTPAIATTAISDAVTLVSGWLSPTGDGVATVGSLSCLAIIPPPAATVIELDLAGVMQAGVSLPVTVFDEQQVLENIDLRSGETKVVRIALIEPGKPVLLVFAQRQPPATPTPDGADAGPSASLQLRQVRALSNQGPASPKGGPRSVAASTEPAVVARFRLDVKSPKIRTEAVNCVKRFDAEGLTVDAPGADPQVVFTLPKRIIVRGRHVYLWGVYEASRDDEMQIFIPIAQSGTFSESQSARVRMTAGLHAFTVSLPYPEDLQMLRLDPAHGAGRTTFSRLELVVTEAAWGEAAPSPPRDDLAPNLERFAERSLLSGLDIALARGCTFEANPGTLRMTAVSADCDVVFAFDPVSSPEGSAVYLVGDYGRVGRHIDRRTTLGGHGGPCSGIFRHMPDPTRSWPVFAGASPREGRAPLAHDAAATRGDDCLFAPEHRDRTWKMIEAA